MPPDVHGQLESGRGRGPVRTRVRPASSDWSLQHLPDTPRRASWASMSAVDGASAVCCCCRSTTLCSGRTSVKFSRNPPDLARLRHLVWRRRAIHAARTAASRIVESTEVGWCPETPDCRLGMFRHSSGHRSVRMRFHDVDSDQALLPAPGPFWTFNREERSAAHTKLGTSIESPQTCSHQCSGRGRLARPQNVG